MGGRSSNGSAAVLVVAALLCTCGAVVATDFDFFYFVLMWPGSYCRASEDGCCLPTTGEPELDFFVKGLYTANSSGDYVTKCNDDKFYVNALSKIIGDMYSYMPSIECPSNNGLDNWKELWGNYGVCSNLTQAQYFERQLSLRSTVNLLPRLRRLGYGPVDGKNFSSGLLQAAVNRAVGNTTRMRCNETVEGHAQLSEVWMCVDTDATTLIECPVYPNFECPDTVMFESFTLDMMFDTSPAFNRFNPRIQMPIRTGLSH